MLAGLRVLPTSWAAALSHRFLSGFTALASVKHNAGTPAQPALGVFSNYRSTSGLTLPLGQRDAGNELQVGSHTQLQGLHADAAALPSVAHPAAGPAPRASAQQLADLLVVLKASLPNAVSTNAQELLLHGTDESYHAPHAPDIVVWPSSTAEVSTVLAACNRASVPVVPFGAGTSIEGHVGAVHGGVCIDLRRMNRVVEVNAQDMDCRVQAGVTRKQLNEYLKNTGLFFPVDPGADATLGGMASTRASGTNAVRYGTMRDAVMGLTVVLADGRVIRTGGRARKSSSGYDLTGLLVGSEGTLGVITEVGLRLQAVPEATSCVVVRFSSLVSAVECVAEVMAAGMGLARVELLDALSIAAVNKYSGTSLPAQPTLFFEFHGPSNDAVRAEAEAVAAVAASHGGTDSQWAHDAEERAKLWAARHSAYWAAISMRPGCKGFPTDVCVPMSHLAECVAASQREVAEAGLLAPLVGHVGDGNFHLMLVIDPNNREEVDKAHAVARRMAHHAIQLQGTCSGEHGVGTGKLEFLELEHGPVAVEMMCRIKAALDPRGIMNPGKLGTPLRRYPASTPPHSSST